MHPRTMKPYTSLGLFLAFAAYEAPSLEAGSALAVDSQLVSPYNGGMPCSDDSDLHGDLEVLPEEDPIFAEKLGQNGAKRIIEFSQYQTNWNEHGAPALSARSLDAARRFLSHTNFVSEPSVFLTDDGNLELLWRDENQQRVVVEFAPSESEYYIESIDEEGTVPHLELSSLGNRLRGVYAGE